MRIQLEKKDYILLLWSNKSDNIKNCLNLFNNIITNIQTKYWLFILTTNQNLLF